MKPIRTCPLLILSVCLLSVICIAANSRNFAAKSSANQVTVPLTVEGNRPFINVTLKGVDGKPREARFLIDSGGGSFRITEPLAKALGLRWDETSREAGVGYGHPSVIPAASVGDFPLELNPDRVRVVVGSDNVLPKTTGNHAEGRVPRSFALQVLRDLRLSSGSIYHRSARNPDTQR